jgi:hypothetical protein
MDGVVAELADLRSVSEEAEHEARDLGLALAEEARLVGPVVDAVLILVE